jgi:hypothetical protein
MYQFQNTTTARSIRWTGIGDCATREGAAALNSAAAVTKQAATPFGKHRPFQRKSHISSRHDAGTT